jgi:hypothetical protein
MERILARECERVTPDTPLFWSTWGKRLVGRTRAPITGKNIWRLCKTYGKVIGYPELKPDLVGEASADPFAQTTMSVGSPLHGPPRWTVVVRANDATLYDKMRQRFLPAPWVAVILDRRRGDRRHTESPPSVERRLTQRRAERPDPSLPRTHRLSQQQPGVAVYELMDLEAATDCATCRATVWFEMPRFSEPPLRLTLQVEHEDVAARHSRHFVGIDAFGAAGRPLLSFRATGRIFRKVR